ncbi:hypothetical protein PILCRDRAFT_812969 [Piloderma croceum F 1598]|uniref:Uncharacterized protein n=1 Tax=Piloderma croceum (strain F 1598) TaxID=765440 RepID=A0A0C3CH41_PILCF|nr:hypothetical protein PILCRDRAFT_812969 [Piloderma croceum F 1598]
MWTNEEIQKVHRIAQTPVAVSGDHTKGQYGPDVRIVSKNATIWLLTLNLARPPLKHPQVVICWTIGLLLPPEQSNRKLNYC